MILSEFQTLLKKHKIEAYLVTRRNMFLTEDILPEENKIMEFTGFTGSAANLLVFQDKAVLFTDGRYEIQAKLETNPQQVKVECVKASDFFPWLNANCQNRKLKIHFNPWCWSAREYAAHSTDSSPAEFIADKRNLLGGLLSNNPVHVFPHEIEFCGIGSTEKISQIAKHLQSKNLKAYLFTAADSVSWLFNLRSNALPDTPVLRAYALVKDDGETTLFAENTDYENAVAFSQLPSYLKKFKKQNLGLDLRTTPQQIISFLSDDAYTHSADPVSAEKAIKNPIELQGIKNAHLRDAAAMCGFLCWLNDNWQGKTELDIVAKLRSFREKQSLFFSDSFPTIAGFGSNGAIVHYQPKPHTNLELKAGSMLLLDSGAQYFDGTTDITRTMAIGTPSADMVQDFTTVLKCHITLASAYFPEKTSGNALDAICRRNLWQQGKNYNHGTGHGVGCFLNVHEGPQNLSSGASYYPLQPNMVNSIEPGYYKENHYGIRIENLVYVDRVSDPNNDIPMLKFEYLTLVPIDKRLIDKYLLDDGEKIWLNSYHQTVYNKISPLVDDKVKNWLKDACSPI